MLVSLPGILGSASGPVYPPAGTLLSSNCSGNVAHDGGPTDYYDTYGTPFNGMFTLWQEFADGAGGSYWTQADNASNGTTSCWLPAYFYFYNNPSEATFEWSGCGGSGTFAYGSNYDYSYSNGDGTATTNSGFNSYEYPSGYTIYDNGSGCCYVYFDGMSGYYVSDTCGGGCAEYGTFLYSGCNNIGAYDASGQYWNGTWVYGNFYADGDCGTYFSSLSENSDGCYYPNGYWMSYSNAPSSFDWYIYDTCGNYITSGSFTYSNNWSGDVADGSGGSNYTTGMWSAGYGDYITGGSYSDCDSNYYNFEVYYDGSGGYYVNTF